jgi:hypothetical protein
MERSMGLKNLPLSGELSLFCTSRSADAHILP